MSDLKLGKIIGLILCCCYWIALCFVTGYFWKKIDNFDLACAYSISIVPTLIFAVFALGGAFIAVMEKK